VEVGLKVRELIVLGCRVFWLWYHAPARKRQLRELRERIPALEREVCPEWFSYSMIDKPAYPFKIEIRPGRILTIGDRDTEVRMRAMWERFQARHRPTQNYTQVIGSYGAASSMSSSWNPGWKDALAPRNDWVLTQQQLAARGLLKSGAMAQQKREVEAMLLYGAVV
jgi:hypothetical protein